MLSCLLGIAWKIGTKGAKFSSRFADFRFQFSCFVDLSLSWLLKMKTQFASFRSGRKTRFFSHPLKSWLTQNQQRDSGVAAEVGPRAVCEARGSGCYLGLIADERAVGELDEGI